MAGKVGANESALAALHTMQTKVFTNALTVCLEAMQSGDTETRLLAVAALKPQLLAAVNSFLNNNKITCTPDQLNEVTAAARIIEERKAAGANTNKLPDLDSILAEYGGVQ